MNQKLKIKIILDIISVAINCVLCIFIVIMKNKILETQARQGVAIKKKKKQEMLSIFMIFFLTLSLT